MEIRHSPSLIVTSYLTGKPDPQRGFSIPPDQHSYLKNWVLSGLKNTAHDQLCVIYNELSQPFISLYASPRVIFYRDEGFIQSKYSIFDYRFFIYRAILKAYPWVESIFFTDCHDVIIKHSPNEYARKGVLYIGRESALIGESHWIVHQFLRTYHTVFHPEKIILNCGIIGGERALVESLINRICEEIEKIDPVAEKYIGGIHASDQGLLIRIT